MAYTFDGPNKKVVLSAGTVAVSVVDLYSRWVDWWVTSDNSKYEMAMRVVGGDPVSGTQNLGLTFFMINGWRIVPDSADHRLTITGNLYTDPAGSSPVDTVPGYSIIVEYSVSNLVDSSVARLDIEELKYAIETLRPSHQGFGQSFFWDPLGGDDGNTGLSPTTAVATFTAAQALVTDGHSNTIYIINNSSTQIVITEQITITKSLSLRGPGRTVKFLPAATTGNTIVVNAGNVSLEGFIVECNLSNTTGDAVQINAKFARLENMWINRGGANCLHFRAGEYHAVENCIIEKSRGAGVRFTDAGLTDGSPREVVFERCQIYWNEANGVVITGTSSNSSRLNQFNKCKIYANTGYGIVIGTNTQKTLIAEDTQLFLNTTGSISDSGTDTVALTYGTGGGGGLTPTQDTQLMNALTVQKYLGLR